MTTTSAGLAPVRRLLANRAVVIAQEATFSPSVTISAAFRAGTLYDPEDRTGLASFLGRVVDRGTAHRSANDLAEALDDCGVTLKVTTNRHVITLACTCLREDFATLLALLTDVARFPIFPQEEIDKRRAETITVIRQDQDNPAVRAGEALQSLLYGTGHPYGMPAKGTVDTVERITRADLVDFHQRWFAPDTASFVIAGDIEPDAAIDQVASAIEDWEVRHPPEREVPPVPSTAERRLLTIPMADKSQSDIAYGFTTISRLHPAYYGYWVMNNILGQFGLGGRLAENIRERQGMAYYVFSSFDPSLGPGPLVIRAGVDPRNVERAIAAIDAEVDGLGGGGPTERELAETKQFLIGSIPRMLETNQSIALFLQTAEFFGLGLDFDRRLPDLIRHVDMEDVRVAAAGVLHSSRAAVAVAGPVAQ